jgi:3-deoxy-7-phosphoheptulonate synthase
MVLRGARNKTNFDSQSVALVAEHMQASGLRPNILVDCSHGNANKRFEKQELAWNAVLEQRRHGNPALIGMLLESNLFEGSQKIHGNPLALRYGVSVTDECVGWETTERMLRHATSVMRGYL